jgi:DNA-directed RNA polymerase subunit RPC12/RpoP
MGFLRKTVLISTGGLAPIRANSKKDRIAKAAEKQVRLQQRALRQQPTAVGARYSVNCPRCSAALVSPAGDNIRCPKCSFRMRVWPLESKAQDSPSSTTGELERLVAMHGRGELSDEEFAQAKARALGT